MAHGPMGPWPMDHGNFWTDGERSFCYTLVAARVEHLPKRDLMGALGPEIIKV